MPVMQNDIDTAATRDRFGIGRVPIVDGLPSA